MAEQGRRENRENQWFDRFALLQAFVAREGHAMVPARHFENGFHLGRWLRAQRVNHDRLENERIDALEKLPGWTWDPHTAKWEMGFQSLLRFIVRTGHAQVPRKHVEDDYKLGIWVSHQRAQYRRGELSDERIKRLDGVPSWTWVSLRKRAGEPAEATAEIASKLTETSVDDLAEQLWQTIFGLGCLSVSEVVEVGTSTFVEQGLLTEDAASKKRALRHLVSKVLDTGVAYGYLDRPRRTHVRAVLRNAEDYLPDDWRMIVRKSINNGPQPLSAAIGQATDWARENVGIELNQLKKVHLVRQKLEQAIEDAVQGGEIALDKPGIIRVVGETGRDS